jgi:hypothetical protein
MGSSDLNLEIPAFFFELLPGIASGNPRALYLDFYLNFIENHILLITDKLLIYLGITNTFS